MLTLVEHSPAPAKERRHVQLRRRNRFRLGFDPTESMELLLEKLGKTPNNAQFLAAMSGA